MGCRISVPWADSKERSGFSAREQVAEVHPPCDPWTRRAAVRVVLPHERGRTAALLAHPAARPGVEAAALLANGGPGAEIHVASRPGRGYPWVSARLG